MHISQWYIEYVPEYFAYAQQTTNTNQFAYDNKLLRFYSEAYRCGLLKPLNLHNN